MEPKSHQFGIKIKLKNYRDQAVGDNGEPSVDFGGPIESKMEVK